MHGMMTHGYLAWRSVALAEQLLADTSEPYGLGRKVVVVLSKAELLRIEQGIQVQCQSGKARAPPYAVCPAPDIAQSTSLTGEAQDASGSAAVTAQQLLLLAPPWSKAAEDVIYLHTVVSNQAMVVWG